MSARARRRSQPGADIWPGFVDALATLLILIIFVLMVFVLGQFFLGQALSGRDQALARLNAEVAQLAEQLSIAEDTNADLTATVGRLTTALDDTSTRLAQLSTDFSSLQSRYATLEARATVQSGYIADLETERTADRATLKEQSEKLALLTHDIAALEALKKELQEQVRTAQKDIARKDTEIARERGLSNEAKAEAALMSQQLQALRDELARLAEALDASDKLTEEQRTQISDLGRRMNRALAGKVQELQRYRSEFFGRLRDILGTRPGIAVVGDRFIFQSEVLFASGSADIGPEGKKQLDQLARTLLEISAEIPKEVDWILRIDGHTDDRPIATARFASNWELSAARAISVVRYLISQGVPSDRLAATGFGEYQPVDLSNTASGRSRNRRIEMKFDTR